MGEQLHGKPAWGETVFFVAAWETAAQTGHAGVHKAGMVETLRVPNLVAPLSIILGKPCRTE